MKLVEDYEQLKQKNEQLRAQMRALKVALAFHHSMVLSGEHETEFSEAIFRNAIGGKEDV